MISLIESRRVTTDAYPDLTILGSSGKVFAIRTKGDTSDIQVPSLSGIVIYQNTIVKNHLSFGSGLICWG